MQQRQKALVAVEHSIITVVWHMLTDSVPYRELVGSCFTQRDPERATRRAVTLPPSDRRRGLTIHRPGTRRVSDYRASTCPKTP
ncbi:hypothetical protein [Streptomyces sp. NPDC092129]|uniref:hypothetical protein n=1 Tax=Streptomyces sp. NPDC092129 TaxID=3366010 RepID=UPI0038280031